MAKYALCRQVFLALAIVSFGHSHSVQTATQAPAQTPASPTTARPQGPGCIPAAEVQSQPNRDLCVSAHVYDVVELPDGTRFLDTCAPNVSDEECRFILLSQNRDRPEVGDLRRFRDQDIQIRGTLRSMHGRMGIVISHVRQFSGGPEKFRPNPKLLREFNAQSDRMPVHDPNLRSTGHHRSFMNTRDQEALPASQKH